MWQPGTCSLRLPEGVAAFGEAQRRAALAVRRVLEGATVSTALSAVADPETQGRGRALVQELTYGTLRHWGCLDALVRTLVAKPFADPALPFLLAVALYQLQHTRAPSFAIVDNAVAITPTLARPGAKGLVNAVLRRFLRERDVLIASVSDDPVARWSYPQWWIDMIVREYPGQWQTVLAAGNERPPLTLRVNRQAKEREALLLEFRHAGITATAVGAQGLIVVNPRPPQELPGFERGAFSVQDAGAQLAAPALQAVEGMRVLDACAAPGGKSTHIVELANVELVALDESDVRLLRVRENFARLNLKSERVRIKVGDAARPENWWDGRPFDRILLDAPCTASGVIRRHPDGKWLRRPSDVASFAQQQQRLLDGVWPLLVRDGRLLYATCSLFDEENEAQIAAFMARQADAVRIALSFAPEIAHRDGQLLPSAPGAGHNQDGFFYALLRKA